MIADDNDDDSLRGSSQGARVSLLARYDVKDGDVDDNNELTQQDGRKKRTVKRYCIRVTGLFCRDLHLTYLCSGLSHKDMFKGRRWSLAKTQLKTGKHKFCLSCHKMIVV